jgi:hypothetical protein
MLVYVTSIDSEVSRVITRPRFSLAEEILSITAGNPYTLAQKAQDVILDITIQLKSFPKSPSGM